MTPPHHSTTPKVFPRSQPVQNLKPFHHQNVSADMKIYKGSCKKKAKRRPRLGSQDGTSSPFQASRWNTRLSGMAGESSRVQEDVTAQHCTAPLTFPGAHQPPCELSHLLCRRPSSPCSLPTCARLAPFHRRGLGLNAITVSVAFPFLIILSRPASHCTSPHPCTPPTHRVPFTELHANYGN